MKKEELLDKYIKYNSKITFDIFKLIYQKLIDLGFTSPHTVEYAFKEFSGRFKYFTLKLYDGKKYFNQFDSVNADKSEISVEDLLGYNPFESFELPEKWCIKVTEDNQKTLSKWRTDGNCYVGNYLLSPYHPMDSNSKVKIGYGVQNIPEDTVEITFDQFKQYVLKEPIITETISESKIEEIVPDYVECFYSATGAFIINKIYKCEKLSSPNNLSLNSETGLKEALPYEGNLWKFKPSTKEAFKAQNKPKLIEKWSVGSYAVALKDKINWSNTQKGDIYEITNIGSATNLTKSYKGLSFSTPKLDTQFKWFATLTEAEKFAKTLVEPIKSNRFPIEGCCKSKSSELEQYLIKTRGNFDSKMTKERANGIGWNENSYWWLLDTDKSSKRKYHLSDLNVWLDKPKQPLKQAVHCKTQEEWDFVTKKLKYEWSEGYWSKYGEDSCIEIGDKGYGPSGVVFKNYQILSFQEWCDLNGYKMTKTRFKKGDYVVSLRPEHLSTYGIKYNYCYIQHEDADKISTESAIMYEDKPDYARLATLEEIEEYKRIGKPYDVTTLRSPTINTYGLNIGDTLDQDIICKWSGNAKNRYTLGERTQWTQFTGCFCGDRVIKSFKVINNVVGFLVSGTNNVYLRADGFKEFADNYYTETTSNFKVGKWYKNLKTYQSNSYGKFSKLDDLNRFWMSEYIYENKYSKGSGWFNYSSDTVECSLEEIQEFLPDGHPDKFVKSDGILMGIKIETNSFYGTALVQRSQSNKEEIYLLPDPD